MSSSPQIPEPRRFRFPADYSIVVRYVGALVLVVIALAIRMVIAPPEAGLPFVTFLPSAALAAILFGFGPGLLAAALGNVLAAVFYVPSLGGGGFTVVIQAVYFGSAALICWTISYYQQHYRRVLGDLLAANQVLLAGNRVKAARERLLQIDVTCTLQDLLVATLDELEALTDSSIGFYHFVEADQNTIALQAWSTRTAREYCDAQVSDRHYPVDRAGIWAECIQSRLPTIHNDYATAPNRKGLPDGHAKLIRELVVPVLRQGKVVAVLGVGNKLVPYVENDLKAVTEFADMTWDLAERKMATEKLIQRKRDLSRNNEELLASQDSLFHAQQALEKRVEERTEQLRQLAVEATLIEERERQAIAADLHDDLGQALHVARIKLGSLAKGLPEGSVEVSELNGLLADASRSVRSLTAQLSPPVLKDFGLVPAVSWLAEEMRRAYDLRVAVEDDGTVKSLTSAQSALLFRATRELLINVAKHSGTDRAVVRISGQDGWLRMSVEDKGGGMADWRRAITAGNVFGLSSVRERITFLGGDMDVRSCPGQGTAVILTLPLDTAASQTSTVPT